MLITFLSNLLISFVILGYSYVFKSILNKNRSIIIYNLDFLYGLFFLIFLFTIINFLLPLSIVKVAVCFFGIIFFFYSTIKRFVKVDLAFLVFFLLVFSIFTYYNSNNVDSPVYHLQTINWIHNYKIPFGLAILDWHYALNSVWHILLAGLSFKYDNFNSIYVLGYIPFAFIFTESLNIRKKVSLSNLTLFLCCSFLLVFSIIHPFRNGIIFNHLGNPEVDTVAMIFFICASFIFFKYIETENVDDFNLLILCSIICPLIKLSYIGALIYPLAAVLLKKKKLYKLFNKYSIFSFILFLIWSLRNLILSSCFIFPIKSTCINTAWSLSNEQVSFYLNQTKSFARDTTLRSKYLDFDHTLNSFDWLVPWLKDYFINDAFLNITIAILIFSLIGILIKKIFFNPKKNFKTLKFVLFILIIYITNFYIWFQAPEIRFGWGILLFFPCLILSLLLLELKIFNFPMIKYKYYSLILLSFILINKNLNNFKFEHIKKPFNKNFSYSNIIKIMTINDYNIYRSLNWQCADFKEICINKPKKHYFIEEKMNYIFISTKDKETV